MALAKDMTNQQKLDFLTDAILNGGESMLDGQSLQGQINRVATQVWNTTVIRDSGPMPALQELADAKTISLQNQAAIVGLTAAVQQLATAQGADPGAITAAVKDAVTEALAGLSATVTIGGNTDG